MKKLLLAAAALVTTHTAIAQCNPNFSFIAAPSGNNLLNVNFTNTTVGTFPPTSYPFYTWKFGDGGVAYGSTTVSHNYPAPGTYLVKLFMQRNDSRSEER